MDTAMRVDRRRALPVRWPAQSAHRHDALTSGRPCLLILDRGTPIPPLAGSEDWIWSDADERDVARRLVSLEARPPATGDATDVLDPALTEALGSLTEVQARVARTLVARHGSVVPRGDLLGDLADEDLDRAVAQVRGCLASHGWVVSRLRRRGFVASRRSPT